MRRVIALLCLQFAASCAWAVSDGELDTAFGTFGVRRQHFDLAGDGRDIAQAMAREPSGNYVLAGEVQSAGNTGVDIGVVRVSRGSGNVITHFSHDAGFDSVRGVAVDAAARVVVVGTVPSSIDGEADIGVARFFGTGTPDSSFAGDGGRTFEVPGANGFDDEPLAVAVRPSGEIVVLARLVPRAGSDPHFYALLAFPADGGSPSGGLLGANQRGYEGGTLLLQPDGKVVLVLNISDGALCHRPRLLRFAPNSVTSLDLSPGASALVTLPAPTGVGDCAPAVRAASFDAQGRLLLAATSRSLTSSASWVARVDTDYTLDAGFSGDGWAPITRPAGGSFHDVHGIGVQSDGRIVTGGTFTYDNASIGDRPILSRLLPGGATDAGYNGVGSVIHTPPIGGASPQNGIALLMDGDRAVLAGSFRANAPLDYDFQVLRTTGRLLKNGFE